MPAPEPPSVPNPVPIQCSPLTASERPLLNKFYKSQSSPMRGSDSGVAWVARAGAIVAALNLSPVPGGHWLTGLLVAQDWRRRQVARRLIERASQDATGCIWLFCHPDLQTFYEKLGYAVSEDLPAVLAERLARYRRSKPLLAMARHQSSAAGSSPGNSTSV
ncbi:GNAT family N-acetyltransferase [Pseudomonas japonica]|uniref:GNAT family N-acetyltransferase n=1 Tax=Pseudomonas japonica TaxID=256466 RepID=UPI0009FCDCD4